MGKWEMKGKPALVLVHMQNSIADQTGQYANSFGHAEAAKRNGIIPRQQALLRSFHQKNLPVIYTLAGRERQPGHELPVYGTFWQTIRASVTTKHPGAKGVEIIPELAPTPGDIVTGNWPIFFYPEVDKVLKDNGVRVLVVAGLATDIAVYITVHIVGQLGYSVIIPEDASASGNARAAEVIMSDLMPQMALVTTTEDVLAHVESAEIV